MPSAVAGLLDGVGLRPDGVVKWGTESPVGRPGVYLVSLKRDPSALASRRQAAQISSLAVQILLNTRPELRLDGARPSKERLTKRLGGFWLPDESILYIGKAGSTIRQRVNQYYCTELGARAPHAGGWFLKTLCNLEDLFVHFAATDEPEDKEDELLRMFVEHVSCQTLAVLSDPQHPFPFANLEWPRGTRKKHGITGATEPRRPGNRSADETSHHHPLKQTHHVDNAGQLAPAQDALFTTQRVTTSDIRTGRIRIPQGPVNKLLPAGHCDLSIWLRTQQLTARFTPRLGGRSARLAVRRAMLSKHVRPEEVLRLRVNSDGSLTLT